MVIENTPTPFRRDVQYAPQTADQRVIMVILLTTRSRVWEKEIGNNKKTNLCIDYIDYIVYTVYCAFKRLNANLVFTTDLLGRIHTRDRNGNDNNECARLARLRSPTPRSSLLAFPGGRAPPCSCVRVLAPSGVHEGQFYQHEILRVADRIRTFKQNTVDDRDWKWALKRLI